MNMHGFIAPAAETAGLHRRRSFSGMMEWARQRRFFLLFVVVPTLIVAGYYYLIAADQYQSEARFVIRSSETGAPAVGGLGQMLAMAGSSSSTQSDAAGVSEYLESHEVVDILRRRMGLVERFRRPEADFLSRLKPADPTPERLEKYYDDKVSVEIDRETGISKLHVRSFRPNDSYDIIRTLLLLGEQRVNELNRRTYTDALSQARSQLADAERGVTEIQSRMTRFRQTRKDIDPAGSGEAQIRMVATMTADLSAARAQLAAMRSIIGTSSPQYQAMEQRVRSLSAELAGQSGRLTGGGSSIADSLGGYEDLKVRQDFAAKRYEAAAANLEKAREEASRQQLYLVRIVEPNKPVKSEYPERGRIVLTVLLGLLLCYAIGWLLAAGVREHVA